LDNALVTLGVVRSGLIGLRESMVIGLPRLIVPETADVGLELRLLFHFDRHDLDLVVSETNLDLKHGWHDELICFNRVEVVLLLLFTTLSTWNMHLILLPL
jgi:hypothetical protein